MLKFSVCQIPCMLCTSDTIRGTDFRNSRFSAKTLLITSKKHTLLCKQTFQCHFENRNGQYLTTLIVLCQINLEHIYFISSHRFERERKYYINVNIFCLSDTQRALYLGHNYFDFIISIHGNYISVVQCLFYYLLYKCEYFLFVRYATSLVPGRQ